MINIYKSFIRPHLEYGDIIYDGPNNYTLSQKIESIQNNAALAITGAIKGSSRGKLYNELGFESLSDSRWCRRLCFFYKITHGLTATYLRSLIPTTYPTAYNLRRRYAPIMARTQRYKSSFFPQCVLEWRTLDNKILNSPTLIN